MHQKLLKDRYELRSKLGEGGMGIVYRGYDPVLARDVAVKMVPALRLNEKNRKRFAREARIVAQMDHPAIVPIHDFGQEEEDLFFVMPLLRGMTLRQLIAQESLSVEETVNIAEEVADALAYSHDQGIIHRDIKPENVMVEASTRRARVMDFGLAWDATEQSLSQTGLLGTPAYLSPEQIDGNAADPRTDLYSLGATLYECLSGAPPFDGPLHTVLYRIGHDRPAPLVGRVPNVPQQLERIVLHCLEKRPEHRPASARDLQASLKTSLLQGANGHESAPSNPGIGAAPGLSPEPPLIGRDAEWAQLEEQLARIHDADCRLLLLSGDAGMGKSRLLSELAGVARTQGIRILRGHYSDLERSFPYQGLCDLIRDAFRANPQEQPSLDDLAPDLLRLFPMLAGIRALRSAATTSTLNEPSSAGTEERNHVFELLARTLLRLGGGRPTLFLLENLHSATVSLKALSYLLQRLGPTRTLIVGTLRPVVDRGHPLRRLLRSAHDNPRILTLDLKPLSRDESHRLAEYVLPGGEVPQALGQRLFEATEGNPLFLIELIRSLRETRTLVLHEGDLWQLSANATLAGPLPETIQQTIESRIEGLPEAQREVLGVATVIGRSFNFNDLEYLVGDGFDLDEAVEQLLRRGILQEEPRSREDRLRFASRLVRDQLYQDLSRRRRRRLHRRYAEYLERMSQGRLEQVYPLLVHHFSAGDVASKTIEYGLVHARQSLRAAGPDDALRTARTALEFLDDEDATGVLGELRAILAEAYRAQGLNARALLNAEAAYKAFQNVGDAPRGADCALLAAQIAWQSRRIDAARRWVDQGIEMAQRADAEDVLRRLLTLGVTVANLRGERHWALQYRTTLSDLSLESDKAQGRTRSVHGHLHVSIASPLTVLDPTGGISNDLLEIVPNVFESLTRIDAETEVVPLLADVETLDNARRFRIRLRANAFFHSGAQLTAEHVRSSFERLLATAERGYHHLLLPIRGATEFRWGEAEHVTGLRLVAPNEIVVELEEPLAFFPALLAHPATAIVDTSSGNGSITGTGPYRLRRFVPGQLVELERSAAYWQPGLPRCERLSFHLGISPTQAVEDFQEDRFSLTPSLSPGILRKIRQDPALVESYREAPRLSTVVAIWNVRRGVLADLDTRSRLVQQLDLMTLVREHIPPAGVVANGLIPPGLLGFEEPRREPEPAKISGRLSDLRIRAAAIPALVDQYSDFWRGVLARFDELGIHLEITTSDLHEAERLAREGSIDAIFCRLFADYPDPDALTFRLLHSKEGLASGMVSSEELDQLCLRGRHETDPALRHAIYRRIEERLVQRVLLLPLFHEQACHLAQPSVQGFQINLSRPEINWPDLSLSDDL